MRKKLAALLLALCMCCAATPSVLAAEDGGPPGPQLTISLPETLPAVGETFTATVNITGNPGVCAVQFTVESDGAAVECVSAETGSVLEGAMAVANPAAQEGAIIAVASLSPLEGDGPVGVLTYRVTGAGSPGLKLSDIVLTGAGGEDLTEGDQPAVPEETKPETTKPETTVPETTKPETTKPETTVPETAKPETIPTERPGADVRFTDVPATHWAVDWIARAVDAGLFQGYADGSFHPGANVTRGQLLTVLWRSVGKPAAAQAAPFTDMGGMSQEFRDAAAWAYETGVTGGYANGDGTRTLRPGEAVSRQQAMTMLYRLSGQTPGMESMLASIYDGQFTDSGTVADYARQAMYWAVYHGYISGYTATTLNPEGPATRAQLAKILVGYLGNAKS